MSCHPRVASLLVVLAIASQPALGQSFSDAAEVASPPCSDDYSLVIDCHDPEAPPAPSLERSMVASPDDDPDVTAFPIGEKGAGKTVILPSFRASNDGRLVLSGSYPRMAVSLFHPENIGYDQQQRGNGSGPAEEVHGHRNSFFAPSVLSPLTSLFDLEHPDGKTPAFNHSDICDDSSPAYSLDGSNSSGRNPRSCTALINGTVTEGDCYDVSLVSFPGFEGRIELHSSKYTIFVPNGKQPDSGYPYLYPRTVGNQLGEYTEDGMLGFLTDTAGNVHYNDAFALETMIEDCIDLPASQQPGRCAFLDHQESSSEGGFVFDANANGITDPGEFWNGNSCHGNWDDPDCSLRQIFEPTISGDGRLLVINAGGLWYSYSETACSAEGWPNWRPLAAMPWDDRVNDRYPLAKTQVRYDSKGNRHIEPFRDTAGEPFECEDGFFPNIKGAYPWMDREVRNIFFALTDEARDSWFGTRQDNSQVQFIDKAPGKGYVALGAWTKGKAVHLDNRLNMSTMGNRQDLNSGGNNSNQLVSFDLQLYQGPPTHFRTRGTTGLQSFENRFNHYDAMSPTMPFDVVWTFASNNQQNFDVVFDEYLDEKALIVGHMNAHLTGEFNEDWFPDDGFVPLYPERHFRFADGTNPSERPFFSHRRTPHLANSATLREGACPPGMPAHATLGCQVMEWTSWDDASFNWNATTGALTITSTHPVPPCPPDTPSSIVGNSGVYTKTCDLSDPQYGETSDYSLVQGPAGGPATLYLESWIEGDSLADSMPKWLELRGGARIEPVGLGGVLGHGVYLDGRNDHIKARFKRPNHDNWYLSLWLDNRSQSTEPRTVFQFGDGSRILLSNDKLVAISSVDNQERAIWINQLGLENERYTHFGAKITTEGSRRRLRFYVNGTRLAKEMVFDLGSKPGFHFNHPAGYNAYVFVGSADDTHPSFEGWVDEFRVYAIDGPAAPKYSYFEEIACNLALGTLIEIKDGDGGAQLEALRDLYDIAKGWGYFKTAEHPAKTKRAAVRTVTTTVDVCEQLEIESHNEPNDLALQHGRGLCVDRVHRNPRPAVANRCRRTAVLELTGLDHIALEPRADFSQKAFCLSCHGPEAAIPELEEGALLPGTGPRYADPRRQPLDRPALLHGCTPITPPFAASSFCTGIDYSILDMIFDDEPKVEPHE